MAARKGSQEGQKHGQKSPLKACDPVMTLRQLAASILGPDAEVGCVEAAATLGGGVTTFNEAVLDQGTQCSSFRIVACG